MVENNNKVYSLLFRGWFNTKERSNRTEYMLRFSMMWILIYIPIFFSSFIDTLDNSKPNMPFIFCVVVFYGTVILGFLALLQLFFVTHRRLHDLNTSGWWQLITFIPLGQLMMIGFIFFKGTEGTNKYGPPPEY